MSDFIFSKIAPFADGAVLAVLGIFSLMGLAIAIERYFFLKPAYRKSSQAGAKLKAILRSGHFGEIKSLAEDTSYPAGRAMAYAMAHITKNGPGKAKAGGLSELFKAAYLQEKPLLEGFTPFLATVGSNAPFVGLLGTVFGVMRSFHDLGAAIQEASQQTVMAGISIALLATALGLAVAIPSVMLYNYFRRRITRILDTLEQAEKVCLAYCLSGAAAADAGGSAGSGPKAAEKSGGAAGRQKA